MKVSCQQEQLAKGLSIVGRAVSTKTTLPVLNNILLATDNENGGRLKLAATNLEISITVWVPATVQEEGDITVPARLLSEFVGSLGSQGKDSTIQLTLDQPTLTLHVKGGRYEANIKGIASEDFPSIQSLSNSANNISVEAGVLKEAINQVAFAASTDETRPVLTGIFANFSGNKVVLAAADSFRLAVRTATLASEVGQAFTAILPSRAMTELARIIPDDDSLVEISVNANKSQALFKTETVHFSSSLIEGNFPNYQQIIPKNYQTRAVLETSSLSQAVRTAGIFAKDSGGNIVKLSILPGEDVTPGSLLLTANAAEVGDNRNEIDASVDGQNAQIAFNAKYMIDVLNVITTGQVALELQSPSNPGVVRPVGKDDYVHVIMPMHLAPR
ncbi:MAG: DNA polymerase III subunit beta [Chloroflexi bacterium]|nr:DNA polymerase III subunit beta [Chloroflexota bacterium]OJV94479.1 MAG: DNA polymerase III subunit beta [Chloroflexi bacterium 54-19]